MPTPSARPADPRGHVAAQLREQARACEVFGSPLYTALLRSAAADVEARGPAWEVLRHDIRPERGDAVALRFMAAVHRLVLARQAPELALHYPSAGGHAPPDRAWPAFRAVLVERADELPALVRRPCQTNEVGRCAGLVCGFLAVAAATGLPLRVLEVGASAGLNLRWDRFRYGGGAAAWGPADSPVDLSGAWELPPPHVSAPAVVVDRAGCDPHPVDPTTPEGRLALSASVWPDQTERFARLRGALTLAERVPAVVDCASVEAWLPGRLEDRTPGVATVVYQSVVEEYLSSEVRARFHEVLADAGTSATRDAPLAWLRSEPDRAYRAMAVRMTTWPGGDERVLATAGAHGPPVRWIG